MSVFIICEYNPFHMGHEYQIAQAKSLFPGQPIVCIMSGNLTQRGIPAVLEKYARASCAVSGGADLVLLLPCPWSFSSAERFACGGVAIASAFASEGDTLLFGSECGDLDTLCQTALNISSDSFASDVTALIKEEKLPFAQARERVYTEMFGDAGILRRPNDILGIEYISQLRKQASVLTPYVIKRADYPSSTSIRKADDPYSLLPHYSARICSENAAKGYFPADFSYAERIIISSLRNSGDSTAADGEHGLFGRIKKASRKATACDELMELCSSSAYTDARIRRVILYSYFKTQPQTLKRRPAFTQLLAADRRGLDVLSNGKIPLITKPADYKKLSGNAASDFEAELAADALYAFMTEKARDAGYSLRATPYIVRD